jgi:hypothetical protein
MNRRSDFDRVLVEWFADGPTAMPDRVVAITADRIGRERQRRAWRMPGGRWLSPQAKLATVVAAGLVIAAVGFAILPRGSSVGPAGATSPPPSATASSSPSTPATELPEPAHTFRTPIGYVLPAGWQARTEDWDILQFSNGSTADAASVTIMPVSIRIASADCSQGNGGPSDLDGMVASLRANAAFSITNQRSTSVGGHRAVTLTVAIAATWTRPCLNSQGRPAAPFLSNPIGLFTDLEAGSLVRLTLVDLAAPSSPPPGGTATLAIVVSGTASTLDAMVTEAAPLIQSIVLPTD